MRLSVIVCTRNRAHAIIPCLDSIAASLAHAASLDAEIVVVDNASEDDTSARVRAWANTSPFRVRLLVEARKGASKARNCGIRAAAGDLLAFIDDDCRLNENYVADLLRYDASDTSPVVRGGRVMLGDPADLPLTITPFTQIKRWHRDLHSARHENLGDALFSCNMAMRRTVINRLGGFDERLGAGSDIPGGEDFDYVCRAYIAGIMVEAVPDMAVAHFHGRKHVAEGNKLLQNYMIGSGAVYAKYFWRHPGLCRQFYWDFKNAIKEMVSGKNTFLPEIGFSHKHKVIYTTLGAMRYFTVWMRP